MGFLPVILMGAYHCTGQGSALVGARCAEKAVVCKVCVQKMSSGSGACGGQISGSTSNDTQSWQKAKKC